MSYEVFYHESVVGYDIQKLPLTIKPLIKKAIEEKIIEHPEVFGKPLRRALKNYRKLRVGDYRIIFRIQGAKIKIIIIAHRSLVYQRVLGRIT